LTSIIKNEFLAHQKCDRDYKQRYDSPVKRAAGLARN